MKSVRIKNHRIFINEKLGKKKGVPKFMGTP